MMAGADSGSSSNKPHAVVIGSGFGGLAAAIRLGARGYRVTVLEKLDAAGGRAYVFHQDGHTFDAGPTIVTAPFLFEELWTLAGRRMSDDVELRSLSPSYRIRFDDGESVDCFAEPERMHAAVMRYAPAEIDGYEKFMQASAELCKVAFEQLGHVPFNSWLDMLRLVPSLMRLQSYRSLHGLVARYVRNPRLRFILSFHPLFLGGNPFTTTSIYGLIASLEQRWGVHFAMGGTGSLVKGMTGLIASQGNCIRYGAQVSQIQLQGQRATGVQLTTGETIAADIVISNADSAWTYRHLLPASARSRWSDRRIERARYSMSLFVWYFGTRRLYPDVPHHTILVGPRYRELLQDIFEHKVLADDFSLYLHRPTATDPSLAPSGHETFYVLSPVPNLGGNINWQEKAEPYRQAIAAHLEKNMLPELAQNVVTSRLMTPLDFQDRLLAYRGAAFGLEPILTQSAWFRPHNRSEDIQGLYLVGAGTHPGAGLPGVLSSARILDTVVPDAAFFR
jgi:phytoene desaturase